MRAFYSAPRLLRYGGEGGDYQQRAWSGVDLIGAGDITIARGTNTMMPRSAKASLARDEMALAVQAGDQMAMQRYQRAITGNTSSLLGLQDDTHRARIERQIAQWKDAAKQQHEAAPQGEPQIVDMDPMGQPIMAPPPPDPVAEQAAQIFAPNPTDEWPMLAPVRALALADAVASKAFLTADPRFQQAIVTELERMRQAAGIQTRAEQQQMQQQQAQQQQADVMAQQAAKQADKTSDDAAQVAYAEDTGGPAAQRMAMQAAAAQQIPTPGVPGMEPP